MQARLLRLFLPAKYIQRHSAYNRTADLPFAAADLAALDAQVRASRPRSRAFRRKPKASRLPTRDPTRNWSLQAAIYGHRKAEFDSKVENFGQRGRARRRDRALPVRYRGLSRTPGRGGEYRGDAQTARGRSKLAAGSIRFWPWTSRAEMARALANAQQTAEGAKRDQAAIVAERDAFIQGWRAEVSQKLSEATGKLSDARER